MIVRRSLRAFLAGVYALFLAMVSVMPASGVRFIAFPHADKLLHLMAYAVLALLVAWNFPVVAGDPVRRRRDVIVGVTCILYGLSLEVVQGTLPYGRQFSLADAAANAAGVISALGGWRFRTALDRANKASTERC